MDKEKDFLAAEDAAARAAKANTNDLLAPQLPQSDSGLGASVAAETYSAADVADLTAGIDDAALLAQEIERQAARRQAEVAARDALRNEERERQRKEREFQAASEAAAQAAKAKKTDNPEWLNWVSELADMNPYQRIDKLAQEEAEALSAFQKNFQKDFQQIVRDKQNEFIKQLGGESYDEYLDRRGLTKKEHLEEISNKVWSEDRLEMEKIHVARVRANVERLKYDAERLAQERAAKYEEQLKVKKTFQSVKEDYEQFIRNELLKEVTGAGISLDVYKNAYNAVKTAINIMSPNAKELTALAVKSKLGLTEAKKPTDMAKAMNALSPDEPPKVVPAPQGIIDRRPKLIL